MTILVYIGAFLGFINFIQITGLTQMVRVEKSKINELHDRLRRIENKKI